MESCPCTDHLRTEEASGHKIVVTKIHPSGEVLPSPTGAFSFPPTLLLTPFYLEVRGGAYLPGRWLQGWLLQGRFLEGRR